MSQYSKPPNNNGGGNEIYGAANRALAAKGHTFHWARRLLGEVHADRATRLYGFCRWIDDLADEIISYEAAKDTLNGIAADIQSGKSKIPLLADMLRLMDECHIDGAIVLELIKGVSGDLELVRMETQSDLLRYCYRVAGTVGLMMSSALDVTNKEALPHAVDLGIGMQLTNICRDISEDARNNRCYMPAQFVGQVEPMHLISPDLDLQPTICEGVSRLLKIADAYYKSGEDGLGYLPVRARIGMLVAGRVYRGIGEKLRNKNHDYWTKRIVIPSYEKAQISVLAVGRKMPTVNFWLSGRQHNPDLHIPLAGLPKVNVQSGNASLEAGFSHEN